MERAVVEFNSQYPVFEDDIDVDSILQGFPCEIFDQDQDLDLWLSSNSSPSWEESEAPKSRYSFAEDGDKVVMEELLADVLVDGNGSGSGSDSGRSEVASPESGGSAEEVVVIDGEEREEREEDEDEQVSKKRRRQMRNRESAMQSRERKKLYVKDLEMKSKCLESECRRLDYALRCCMAENFALHQRLQKDRAPAAKQESAVLFEESLLLGSLFWLVSIVFLYLAPGLQLQTLNPKDASRLERGRALEVAGSKAVSSKKSQPGFGNGLVIMRRRCRGLRTRMKSILFPLHALSAY